MRNSVHREITQLSPEDSFLVYERIKDDFDFPIHFHPEYELNFIYTFNRSKTKPMTYFNTIKYSHTYN